MLRKLVIALLCASPAALAASDARVKIAVLDLQARGVDKALVDSASTLIASELNKLEVFKVISRDDIRNMLSFEKDKQAVGCEADQACMAEIGGALGVEYIVAGSLAKIGDTLVLSLVLSKGAAVENRLSETVPGKTDALIAAISRNSRALVSKILKGREGFLVLAVAETGAVVKIDGQIRGTTPLKGRMILNWGPHLLEVEKAGFVSYSEDISVPNKQVLAKNLALVPSNDFINSYEGSARKMRIGAWITTGLAVAGAATAITFNQLAASTETRFAAAQATWKEGGSQDTALYGQMNRLSNRGNTQVLLSRAGLAVGAAALGFATYFWVAGDDPHRYESYREAPPEPAPAPVKKAETGGFAAPLEGGALVGLAGRF
jgi:TolB-like protein